MERMKGISHGKGRIDLTHLQGNTILPMVPVEVHLKEDGALDDTPSFCFVLKGNYDTAAYGEVSLKMLNEALADIGYEISKK